MFSADGQTCQLLRKAPLGRMWTALSGLDPTIWYHVATRGPESASQLRTGQTQHGVMHACLGPSARGCSFGRNCCSQPAQALVWERPFWSKEGLRLQSAQRPISGFCANSRRGRHEWWDAGRQGLRPPSGETPLDPKNRICISTSAAIQDVFCRDTSLERTTSFL